MKKETGKKGFYVTLSSIKSANSRVIESRSFHGFIVRSSKSEDFLSREKLSGAFKDAARKIG